MRHCYCTDLWVNGHAGDYVMLDDGEVHVVASSKCAPPAGCCSDVSGR